MDWNPINVGHFGPTDGFRKKVRITNPSVTCLTDLKVLLQMLTNAALTVVPGND